MTCESRRFAKTKSTSFAHFAPSGDAISGMVYVPMPDYETTRMSDIRMFQKQTRDGVPDNRRVVCCYLPSSA